MYVRILASNWQNCENEKKLQRTITSVSVNQFSSIRSIFHSEFNFQSIGIGVKPEKSKPAKIRFRLFLEGATGGYGVITGFLQFPRFSRWLKWDTKIVFLPIMHCIALEELRRFGHTLFKNYKISLTSTVPSRDFAKTRREL